MDEGERKREWKGKGERERGGRGERVGGGGVGGEGGEGERARLRERESGGGRGREREREGMKVGEDKTVFFFLKKLLKTMHYDIRRSLASAEITRSLKYCYFKYIYMHVYIVYN